MIMELAKQASVFTRLVRFRIGYTANFRNTRWRKASNVCRLAAPVGQRVGPGRPGPVPGVFHRPRSRRRWAVSPSRGHSEKDPSPGSPLGAGGAVGVPTGC